jgi:hypothetical protein
VAVWKGVSIAMGIGMVLGSVDKLCGNRVQWTLKL